MWKGWWNCCTVLQVYRVRGNSQRVVSKSHTVTGGVLQSEQSLKSLENGKESKESHFRGDHKVTWERQKNCKNRNSTYDVFYKKTTKSLEYRQLDYLRKINHFRCKWEEKGRTIWNFEIVRFCFEATGLFYYVLCGGNFRKRKEVVENERWEKKRIKIFQFQMMFHCGRVEFLLSLKRRARLQIRVNIFFAFGERWIQCCFSSPPHPFPRTLLQVTLKLRYMTATADAEVGRGVPE